MTGNTLAMFEPSVFKSMMNYADALVKSGFLPGHVKNAQQVIAIITYGQELGVGSWTALTGIQVIGGKPTVSPALMLALINRSGKLADLTIESTAQSCTVTMQRVGRTPHSETFTFKDAQDMGLASKDNYKKQPAVMLKWRAVSACARVVFPDVLAGLYTTEELSPDNTTITEDGEVIYNTPQLEAPVKAWTKQEANEFQSHWRGMGLSNTAILNALGVSRLGEWLKTVDEADDVMNDWIIDHPEEFNDPRTEEDDDWLNHVEETGVLK